MRGLLQIPPRYGGLLGDVELPLVDPHLAVNEKAPPRAPGMVMAPVAGMTGTRAPSAVQRLFRGLGNGVGNVLAGADDPSLSAEQNAKARNAAIIRAGLAMMAAGGQGASLGEVLAGGAMAGQEAGMQSRAGYGQERVRAKMQEIIASGAGSAELRQMFQQAVASGDQQMATAVATALQAVEATERGAATANPATWVQREGLNPETGKPEIYRMDLASGQIQWTGVQPIPPRTASDGGISETQRFSQEQTLVNDYQAQVKPYADAYMNIIGSLRDAVPLARNGDGAAQYDLVVSFVKSLDPSSVAREGEVDLARQAASIWDQVKRLEQKFIAGEPALIPPELVNRMASLMEKRARGYNAQWERERAQVVSRAKRWGVDEGAFMAPPPVPTATPAPRSQSGYRPGNPFAATPTP